MAVRHGRYKLVFKGDRFAVLDQKGHIVRDEDGRKIAHRVNMDGYVDPASYDWKFTNRLYWR